MLYCCKCHKWAYKTHKCDIMSLIPLKREMRPVVDALFDLGFEILSSSCFTTPMNVSIYERRITLEIEFKYQYPIMEILRDLPTGWKYYTEVVGADWPISVLAYIETYTWPAYETAEKRINQIVTELVDYLGTRDKDALQSIMMLMD